MEPVKMWAAVFQDRCIAVYWRRQSWGAAYVRVLVTEVRKKKRGKRNGKA